MIRLKNSEEIKTLREGGKILAEVIKKVSKRVAPGVTTEELDAYAEFLIREAGGEPSFKGYGDRHNPFPATLCISIDEELVHGIPSERKLCEGMLVSLDVGMRYPAKTGLYTDMAVTLPVGKINEAQKNLIKTTEKSLALWIKLVKPGKQIRDIAGQVQEFIESHGYGVVRDLVGHGVGHAVHEDPQIPNYYMSNLNVELKEGMVLAIEPMVTMGDYRIRTLRDGWTIITADKCLCAHAEHTLVVTKKGCEVLTK